MEERLEGSDAACHDGELYGANGEDVGDDGGNVRVGVEEWPEEDKAECDHGNKSTGVKYGVVAQEPGRLTLDELQRPSKRICACATSSAGPRLDG